VELARKLGSVDHDDGEAAMRRRASACNQGCAVIGMSASWEVASTTQISRSGAAETGTLATQVADHIGGSSRNAAVRAGYALESLAPAGWLFEKRGKLGVTRTRALGMSSLVVLGQDLADLAWPVGDGLAAGPGIGFPAPASTPEVAGIPMAQACQHSSARRSAAASAEETGTCAPSRRRAVTAAARATRSVPGSAAPTRVLLNWARIPAGSSS
jgi:hypothetical protein